MPTTTEPTTPGWYRYDGGANLMMFLLRPDGQWWAFFDNGMAGACAWGYVEQALGVWDLLLVAPIGQAALA